MKRVLLLQLVTFLYPQEAAVMCALTMCSQRCISWLLLTALNIGKDALLCLAEQVKAGQNQADWEKSGWIAAQDPRGWFHWYCRFYRVRFQIVSPYCCASCSTCLLLSPFQQSHQFEQPTCLLCIMPWSSLALMTQPQHNDDL